MRSKTDYFFIAGILVVIAGIALYVGWRSYSDIRATIEYDQWVRQIQAVLLETDELLSVVTDAETGQRGFIITGREDYLQPYAAALRQVHVRADSLRRLLAGNQPQQERLRQIERLIEEKFAELKRTIEVRRREGFGPASEIVRTDIGKATMDKIRVDVAELQREETRLLNSGDAAMKKALTATLHTLSIGGLLTGVIILLSVVIVAREAAARARAEAQIRTEEEFFQSAFAYAPVGIEILDPQGGYLKGNHWLSTMLGYSEEELQNLTFAAITNKDDLRDELRLLERLQVREIPSYAIEKRYIRKDGRNVWVRVTSSLLGERGPNRVSVIENIEERKRADERLRASESQFRHLAEALPQFIWMASPDGAIEYFNAKWYEYAGATREEALGEGWMNFLHPDDRGRTIERWKSSVESKEPYEIEYRFRRADGEYRWFLVRGLPVKNAEGEVVRWFGSCTDIEERKRADERLRASEAQFRNLAETLPQLVWMARPDRFNEYQNAKWYEYTGSTPQDALGWGWERFIHPEDRAVAWERWQQSVESKDLYEIEYRFRRADGEYRWFLSQALPLLNAEGEIVRWFGSLTDIEDQKRAREAAEEAARAKSTFMANMSHEIRTPMNGILGMTDLLLDSEPSPLQRQYLDMVKSSAEALLSVVNDILDFSKIEAGAAILESLDFDLRETVAKAAEPVAISAFQKGLELVVLVEPDLPDFFQGDAVKLRQVLLNLIGNAVKFTDQGEVAVRVEGTPAEEDTWLLHFSVADTGIGIPEEKQGMLFQSFTQLDTSTARSHGGTGLGLAISKRIVEQMGGRIWAESREGKGSTFQFEVRLPTSARPPAVEAPPFQRLAGLKTLILDDNETNRLMLQRSLTAKGLKVDVAEFGREAIEKIIKAADAGHPYDLALIDGHLPDIDGFQVAEKLREYFPLEKLVLMMITSDDVAGGTRRARDLGMAGYVVKPVRVAALLETLMHVRKGAETAIREEGPQAQPAVTEIPFCTHVLVAEDNPVNLTVAETVLRKAGARVTSATNGGEAIDAYLSGRFNVILMDVQMPKMDGYEATRVLRTKGAKVPIIGLTAYALAGDRERCISAGMDDYLSKPITARRLKEKVAYWVQQRPLPATDPEKLLETIGGERSALDLVVTTFQENAPGQLADVKGAVESADPERLQKAAHRIKGALAVMAAETARCLAEELEKAGKKGDLSNAPVLLARLEAEMARVREELARLK